MEVEARKPIAHDPDALSVAQDVFREALRELEEDLRLDGAEVLRQDLAPVYIFDDVRESLPRHAGGIDGSSRQQAAEIERPLPARGELPGDRPVIGCRRGVVGELKDSGDVELGGLELLLRVVEAAARPFLGVFRQRPYEVECVIGVLHDAIELEVVPADGVVRITYLGVLVGESVLDHHAAPLLKVAERRDDLGRLTQPDVLGNTGVERAEGVEIARDHTEAEWDAAAEQIVGNRAQRGRVVRRGDVLQAHQRLVALRGARRERIEEHVLECEAAVALDHEHERVLSEIRQISRADRPRKPRTVRADGEREHDARTVLAVVQNAGCVGGVTPERGPLVHDLGDGAEIERGPHPAVGRGEAATRVERRPAVRQLPDVVGHPDHRPAAGEDVVEERDRQRLVVGRAEIDDSGVLVHLAGDIPGHRLGGPAAEMADQIGTHDPVQLSQPAELAGDVVQHERRGSRSDPPLGDGGRAQQRHTRRTGRSLIRVTRSRWRALRLRRLVACERRRHARSKERQTRSDEVSTGQSVHHHRRPQR